MIASATAFLRSPAAEALGAALRLGARPPLVSAHAVSLAHACLSVASVRWLASERLRARQLGVALFQLRNFLDSFDGVVYRARSRTRAYASNYGSGGYWVDALSDTLGGKTRTFAFVCFF